MALVSHRYKFIYFKTYKTASTSMYDFLAPLCTDPDIKPDSILSNTGRPPLISKYGRVGTFLNSRNVENWGAHISALEVKNVLGNEIFNSYYKFTTVRNPFQVAVSAYRHNHQALDERSALFEWKRKCFETYLPKHPYEENWDIYTVDDIPICNYYIRYESLIENTNHVLNHLRLPPIVKNRFPFLRSKGQSKNYRSYYEENRMAIYREYFKKELEFFNYEF